MDSGNYENTKLLRTYINATGAISKGCAVITSGVSVAVATGEIKGIADRDIAIGEEVVLCPPCEVRKVLLGATVVAGAKLTVETAGTGRLITATIAGDVVVAIANEGGDADDEINAWIVSPYELGA